MDTPPATNAGADAAAAAPVRSVSSGPRFGAARLARGQKFGMAALGVVLAATLALELLRYFAPESLANAFGIPADKVDHFAPGAQAAILGLLIAGLLVWLATVAALARTRRHAERIDAALSSMHIGLAVWDNEDRLVECNEAFRAAYPEVREHLTPGVQYRRLLETYYPLAPAEVTGGRSLEQFVADAMRQRGGRATELIRHQNDRWLIMTDARSADGGIVSFRLDITEQRLLDLELRKQRKVIDDLAELSYDWYWRQDAEGRFVEFSAAVEQHLRYPRAALLGRMRTELPGFHADPGELAAYLRCIEARQPFPWFRFRAMRGDGTPIWVAVTGKPVFDESGAFDGYCGVSRDVTDSEAAIIALRAREERFRALTELSCDWFWEMDASLRFTSIRRSAHGAFDFAEEEVIGKRRWELPGELIRPVTWAEHRATLEARRPFRDLMLRHVKADGSVVYYISSGEPIFDDNGAFRGYRGVGKNITEPVRARERMERLATVDPLTQLPNRQTFDERAGRILASAYAEGRRCALLFIDLDNFRLLNNGYGHRVGDRMLRIVANRMRAIVAEPNLLGRRGGDELVILLTDVPRPDIASETAQALIRVIAEPVRVFGMEVSVTPSVGIALFPQDGADIDSLLNAADAAMYQAKESGRRTYSFFTPSVARRVDLRLRLEQRLRKAVEARDFRLFYQPLVSLVDGKMIGAEALIRWKDAELGDIAPAEFIPIAEESGLIIGLGDWVLREACRARQVWRQLGLEVPPLAVNMSGVQLRQLGCVEHLLETLAKFEVTPSEVEVEVTETGLLDTTAVSRENLIRLRNAGVKLALDDFGVGFSSLSHLRDLPIHRLKIDRSFTVECMRDARTLTIVKAVIEMARSLGISVTAEGIETQAQQTWMQHLGCDTAQGYLFARPMPADEFLRIFVDRLGIGRERSLMH